MERMKQRGDLILYIRLNIDLKYPDQSVTSLVPR